MPELEPSGGIGRELPGQPRQDPVAQHAHVRRRLEHLGAVLGEPQEPGRGGDRDPVAGGAVDPLGGARLDQARWPARRRASRRWGRPTARSPRSFHTTMPSRMLVALTAAMSAPETPARSQRLAHALADQRPVGAGREHLRTGHAGLLVVLPLALPEPDRVTAAVEDHGPAAAGAGVDCEREVAHMRCLNASPRGEPADLVGHHRDAAIDRLERGTANVRCDHDVGQVEQGISSRRGAHDVERGAAEMAGGQRVHERGLVDERLAGGVDEERAVAHRGELLARHQVLVFGRDPGVQRDEIGLLEQVLERQRARRRVRATRPRSAGRRRSRPYPALPRSGRRDGPPGRSRRRPASCRPARPRRTRRPRTRSRPARRRPAETVCDRAIPRASMIMKATVSSTTASAFLPGVFVTGMPRSRAACRSTLTGPPRAQHTSRRPGVVEHLRGHGGTVHHQHVEAGELTGERLGVARVLAQRRPADRPAPASETCTTSRWCAGSSRARKPVSERVGGDVARRRRRGCEARRSRVLAHRLEVDRVPAARTR